MLLARWWCGMCGDVWGIHIILSINVVIKSPPSSSSWPTSSKQVVRAAGNKKCDFYTETRGFECVPYYQVLILPDGTFRQWKVKICWILRWVIGFQCDDDGTIITDGAGLIDIRSYRHHPHNLRDHRDCHPHYHHIIVTISVIKMFSFRRSGLVEKGRSLLYSTLLTWCAQASTIWIWPELICQNYVQHSMKLCLIM